MNNEMNQANSSIRLYYIDHLRVFLTFLVLTHHTLITYGGNGGWYFKDPVVDKLTSIVLSVGCGLNQGFFMALFFFISAYFLSESYRRKRKGRFFKERLLRLGVPILIYSMIINPLMNYFLSPGEKSLLEYLISYYKTASFISGTGPLWFLVALLIFAGCYSLWQEFVKVKMAKNSVLATPSLKILLCAVLCIAIPTFIIRIWFPINGGMAIFNIQLTFITQYIVLSILGVLAFEHNWLRTIPDKQGKLWLTTALLSILYFAVIAILSGGLKGDPVPMLGGFHWQSLAFTLWEGVYGIGMSIGLVVLFRKKISEQGKIRKVLSDNAYTIYLIHAPVLVGISYLMAEFQFPPVIKFFLVLATVVVLCFAISHFILRRITGAKKVLG